MLHSLLLETLSSRNCIQLADNPSMSDSLSLMYANGYMTSSSSGHSAITQSKHQSKDSEKATTSTILPSAVLRWLTRRSIAWFGRIICKVTSQAGDWMKRIQLWMLYLMESEKENMFWYCSMKASHQFSASSLVQFFLFSFLFFSFIFISWRLITSQHCSGFCHTLTWISHGVTSIPHPDPPSTSLSTRFLWVFPVHQARALVSCIPILSGVPDPGEKDLRETIWGRQRKKKPDCMIKEMRW